MTASNRKLLVIVCDHICASRSCLPTLASFTFSSGSSPSTPRLPLRAGGNEALACSRAKAEGLRPVLFTWFERRLISELLRLLRIPQDASAVYGMPL